MRAIDSPTAHPVDGMRAAGVDRISRYRAPDIPVTRWKLCSVSEAQGYVAANFGWRPNWEWYEGRPLEGYGSGLADGRSMVAFCRQVGPADGERAIVYSVDMGTTATQWAAVIAYFHGVLDAHDEDARAHGGVGYRVGYYGGLQAWLATNAAHGGRVPIFWQAGATSWSAGRYPDARAQWVQRVGGSPVGNSDVNDIQSNDDGTWWAATGGDDMGYDQWSDTAKTQFWTDSRYVLATDTTQWGQGIPGLVLDAQVPNPYNANGAVPGYESMASGHEPLRMAVGMAESRLHDRIVADVGTHVDTVIAGQAKALATAVAQAIASLPAGVASSLTPQQITDAVSAALTHWSPSATVTFTGGKAA